MTDNDKTLENLEEKMRAELEGGHPYEALQYVQSFIARKKKTLGPDFTSALVYRGAKQLVKFKSPASAGALLAWFIEGGAGAGYQFKFATETLGKNNYCDSQRLLEFVTPLSTEDAAPVVDAVYGPFHIFLSKATLPSKGTLPARINKLEVLFASTFERSKRWISAFKAYGRLADMEKVTRVVHLWSLEGYKSERPLFFARAVLLLLSERKISYSVELVNFATEKYIQDNIDNKPTSAVAAAGGGSGAAAGSGVEGGGGPMSASLAVWHLAVILSDLAVMPPLPRVDKAKLFGILRSRYEQLLSLIDDKLLDLFLRTGEIVFGYKSPESMQPGPNPMAMLQGLLGGGGGGRGAGAAPDMQKMMSMMNQMQGRA